MTRKNSGKRTVGRDGSIRVHGKASNGEGSLYRDSDGSWRATFRLPGEARPRRVRGRTREEAIERRTARMIELAQSVPGTFERDITITVLAGWWLDNVARHSVRPSSFAKYGHRVDRISSTIGHMPVRSLKAEHVARWQSDLLKAGLSSSTVGDLRTTLRQLLEQGVIHELIARNPVDRVAAPKLVRSAKRALPSDEARRLIDAAATDRLGAAVVLLFVQGWRVSEVLGLAWEDLDLDQGIAKVKRAAVYIDAKGMALGPTKNAGASGTHHLSAGVVEQLRARRAAQAAERLAAGAAWESHTYEGRPVSLVFTTRKGAFVNRQAVAKAVTRAASAAGIDPTGLSTHTGRRTVVTALYSEAGLDLSDIARFVGHAGEATTAGYVRSLGERPRSTAAAAAALLDPRASMSGS